MTICTQDFNEFVNNIHINLDKIISSIGDRRTYISRNPKIYYFKGTELETNNYIHFTLVDGIIAIRFFRNSVRLIEMYSGKIHQLNFPTNEIRIGENYYNVQEDFFQLSIMCDLTSETFVKLREIRDHINGIKY